MNPHDRTTSNMHLQCTQPKRSSKTCNDGILGCDPAYHFPHDIFSSSSSSDFLLLALRQLPRQCGSYLISEPSSIHSPAADRGKKEPSLLLRPPLPLPAVLYLPFSTTPRAGPSLASTVCCAPSCGRWIRSRLHLSLVLPTAPGAPGGGRVFKTPRSSTHHKTKNGNWGQLRVCGAGHGIRRKGGWLCRLSQPI